MKVDEQNLFESIFKLVRSLKARNIHGGEHSNLSILQAHTLIFIKKNQPIPMHKIAESFQISKPTVTSLVDVLMDGGFVGRVDDKEDRRIIRIKLTKQGEQYVSKGIRKTTAKVNKILSYLPLEDKKHLKRIIETINKKLEEENEKNTK
jgi:DNA-binding MarR family transcriptional regulator